MINTGAKKGRTTGTCEYEYWILGAMILLGSPVQEVTQVARFFHWKVIACVGIQPLLGQWWLGHCLLQPHRRHRLIVCPTLSSLLKRYVFRIFLGCRLADSENCLAPWLRHGTFPRDGLAWDPRPKLRKLQPIASLSNLSQKNHLFRSIGWSPSFFTTSEH
jgi:hypothetical protein